MQLSEINPLGLPSIPLFRRKSLPKCCAIYFCIDAVGAVLYIGASRNLNHRWLQHHRYQQLIGAGNVRLAWMETPVELLNEIEAALIEWFNPPLNKARSENTSNRNSDRIQISVYLDKELKDRIAKLARKQRRSVSNLIEVLCEEAVERSEQDDTKRAS